jgi:hypothetical protein
MAKTPVCTPRDLTVIFLNRQENFRHKLQAPFRTFVFQNAQPIEKDEIQDGSASRKMLLNTGATNISPTPTDH